MSRGKGRQPPKKKHEARARPLPIVPLSDQERTTRSRLEFEKAAMHLIEAERLAAWGQAPNACVHSAYYAMHHCAAAALLAAGGVGKRGDVPKSHEHVIEHFAKLVEPEPEALRECGKMLSRARSERMLADYDLGYNAADDDARATVGDAKAFVEACSARWALRH